MKLLIKLHGFLHHNTQKILKISFSLILLYLCSSNSPLQTPQGALYCRVTTLRYMSEMSNKQTNTCEHDLVMVERKNLSAESGEGGGQVSMWSQCIMGNPQQHINEVAWDHPIHPLMKPVIGPTYGWAEIWRSILIFSSIFEPSQLLKHRGQVSIAGKQCFSCSTSFLLKIRAVILRLRAEQWEFGFKLWHLEWV